MTELLAGAASERLAAYRRVAAQTLGAPRPRYVALSSHKRRYRVQSMATCPSWTRG